MKLERKIYKTVRPTMMYGSVCSALNQVQAKKIRMLRLTVGVSRFGRVRNELGRNWRIKGKDNNKVIRMMMVAKKAKRGRPNNMWKRTIKKDLNPDQ